MPRIKRFAAAAALAAFAWTADFAVGERSRPAMQTARGVVFLDKDGDGLRGAGEPGLENVKVSNGRDVVRSGPDGGWSLDVDDDDIVFVIKPRGYMTATDHLNLPRFYYIHKPQGSPDGDFLYEGVRPTGPLPESIDFALTRRDEPDAFRALLFGDPQPYSEQDVAYYARQVVGEVREAKAHGAEFVVVLGDLLGDYLELYEPYNAVNASMGVPEYNVYGNHDMNFKSPNDAYADETFERTFGPATYAFQYGPVHFVVLDNVRYDGFHGYREDGFPKTGNYQGHLSDEQLTFLKNLVETIPRDEKIVLLLHIPFATWEDTTVHTTPQHPEVLRILSGHAHTASFSAHTHRLWQVALGSEAGYTATGPDGSPAKHWHVNAGATCGSWWRGPLDERGLPLTTMTDGTPNGYLIADFDGSDMRLRWKSAGEPASDQMRIRTPDVVSAEATGDLEIVVNAFMATDRETVEAQVVDARGVAVVDWFALRHMPETPDPGYAAMYEADQERGLSPEGKSLRRPSPCTHLFGATLPRELEPGSYWVEVRFADRFGFAHVLSRPLRVTR